MGVPAVNFLCRQHGFTLKIVDAGVDYDLPYEKGIINMKVRKGTRNYLHEAAMDRNGNGTLPGTGCGSGAPLPRRRQ